MNLKNKLSVNSTLLFAFTVGLVLAGSFLLFKKHRQDLYFERLEDSALITAFFILKKMKLQKLTVLATKE